MTDGDANGAIGQQVEGRLSKRPAAGMGSPPVLTKSEVGIVAHRNWCKQFYSEPDTL